MFVDTFTFLLPLALGFAAGCMTWMVFAELIPDSLADAPHGKVSSVLLTCPVQLLVFTGTVARQLACFTFAALDISKLWLPLALQSDDSPQCSA